MEHLNSIRRNLTPSQIFFLLIMIPLISFMPILYECCESFYRFRRLERPDYENSKWSDFNVSLILVPLISISKYCIRRFSEQYFRRLLKKKYSGESFELRVQKSIRNAFKIVYFGFMTAFGLYVYADTNYQSPFMLGRGNHMLMGSDWPYNRVPRCLKVYYMMNFSYHLEDLLAHLIHPAQNDFFEMLLHHYITLMLVAGSYMTNVWNSGINAMIQMDNGDFFVGVVKTFIDVIPAVAVFCIYLCLLSSWIYFRVFIFTKEVIWEETMAGRWRIDDSPLHQNTIQILLFFLLVLNVYWAVLILKSGLRFLKKGDAKDMQNPVIGDSIKNKPSN